MAFRFSTGCINKVASGFGWREVLRDGRLYVSSGTQPTTADLAPTGSLLYVATAEGLEFTAATQSQAKITLSGAAGSVDTVTVGGSTFNLLPASVAFSTDLTTTASFVAASINASQNLLNITATSSGADVTLALPSWLGAYGNGLTLAVTTTTLTASVNGGSSAAFGGAGSPAAGVSAVNGLNLLYPASAGVLTKDSASWYGTASASGSAGWARYVAGGSSFSGDSTTDVRFDMSIATSGADVNVASTSVVKDAVQVIPSFTFTVPASAA